MKMLKKELKNSILPYPNEKEKEDRERFFSQARQEIAVARVLLARKLRDQEAES